MERSILTGLQNSKIVKDCGNNFAQISTDTRTLSEGDFYLPLKGENFDGEKFIDAAIQAGAVGFLTTNSEYAEKYVTDDRVKFIAVVPDTRVAYLELAAKRIKDKGFKVVGITGSSGKTTTKEMVFAVLSSVFKVHKTALNHNNEIGFCQTVFEAPDDTQVLIVEMGMRGLGEIELIARFAAPDISIVTNVGTAHIGRLGSRENIAKAKCEIALFTKPEGVFIAKEDALIKSTVEFSGAQKYYSINDAEILKKEVGFTKFKYQSYEYDLPIEGFHNVENSMAAINAGLCLGMTQLQIFEGLRNFKTIENRWNVEKFKGVEIINDCYNANPESMKATISTILDLYNSPVFVLGNMGELGEDSVKYHEEIGLYLNNHSKLSKNSMVITVGELAKSISEKITKCETVAFLNNFQAADYILKNDNIGNILFFKASRSMKFEEIINKIKGDL